MGAFGSPLTKAANLYFIDTTWYTEKNILILNIVQTIKLNIFIATTTFQSIHSPTIFRCTTGWKTSIILRRVIIILRVVQHYWTHSLCYFCCYYYVFIHPFSNHLQVYNWMEDNFYNKIKINSPFLIVTSPLVKCNEKEPGFLSTFIITDMHKKDFFKLYCSYHFYKQNLYWITRINSAHSVLQFMWLRFMFNLRKRNYFNF